MAILECDVVTITPLNNIDVGYHESFENAIVYVYCECSQHKEIDRVPALLDSSIIFV